MQIILFVFSINHISFSQKMVILQFVSIPFFNAANTAVWKLKGGLSWKSCTRGLVQTLLGCSILFRKGWCGYRFSIRATPESTESQARLVESGVRLIGI